MVDKGWASLSTCILQPREAERLAWALAWDENRLGVSKGASLRGDIILKALSLEREKSDSHHLCSHQGGHVWQLPIKLICLSVSPGEPRLHLAQGPLLSPPPPGWQSVAGNTPDGFSDKSDIGSWALKITSQKGIILWFMGWVPLEGFFLHWASWVRCQGDCYGPSACSQHPPLNFWPSGVFAGMRSQFREIRFGGSVVNLQVSMACEEVANNFSWKEMNWGSRWKCNISLSLLCAYWLHSPATLMEVGLPG